MKRSVLLTLSITITLALSFALFTASTTYSQGSTTEEECPIVSSPLSRPVSPEFGTCAKSVSIETGEILSCRAIITDGDLDGIPDAYDRCTEINTSFGFLHPIDWSGCTVSQFCRRFDDTTAGVCNSADWNGDEAGSLSKDCTWDPQKKFCLGRGDGTSNADPTDPDSTLRFRVLPFHQIPFE